MSHRSPASRDDKRDDLFGYGPKNRSERDFEKLITSHKDQLNSA